MKSIFKFIAAMLVMIMPLTSCHQQPQKGGNDSQMLTEQNSIVKTQVELSANIYCDLLHIFDTF